MRDFGRADVLEPDVTGEPGQRTFRVLVMSGRESAALWLEKEQLAALALAIRQLLEQTSGADTGAEPTSPQSIQPFPEQPDLSFKLARLGIGYDEATQLITIFAYDIEEVSGEKDDDDAIPAFSCQAGRGQCRDFAGRAEEIVSAGRPVCVLCGGPIDDGDHLCLRRNGHSQRPSAAR
ncbi:MAG: DUF3090 family protein [Chloroflexi bacterium]|nr:DUF3090 family protein [Chloroflexota bacterium]